MMNEPLLTADDIQGNIAPGFGKQYQLFVSLKLHEATAGRWLLKALLPAVTPMSEVYHQVQQRKQYLSEGKTPPDDLHTTWLNLAISAAGLRLFGRTEIEPLDSSFRKGMAALSGTLGDPRQAQINGQPNPGHKDHWLVGGPENEGDLLIIIAADTVDQLEQQENWLHGIIHATEGVEIIHTDKGERLPGDKEHFGFKDGISQPGVRGLVPTEPPEPLTTRYLTAQAKSGPEFGRPGQPLIWPGQFILGYPRQSKTDYRAALPVPTDIPPLARNGSFLVYRRL